MPATPRIEVLASDWDDYALLDSGNRRKLERFGGVLVAREEPKAWWRPALPEARWREAAAVYDEARGWSLRRDVPRAWEMRWESLVFEARLSEGSKHLGVFPEQSPHWEWISAFEGQAKSGARKALNLFGYTGAATLAAARAGFAVTHVDASRPAVQWARANQARSNLEKAPVRWILDDALKFVRREARRGNRYDLILMDPPSFGRGPSGEVWKVERSLPELLACARQCLTDNPLGFALTLYALEASPLMLGNLLAETMRGFKGEISVGEFALRPQHGANLLPLSLWGRWRAA